MKRKNFFSKAMILLLTVSMSIFIFAGCQSKDNSSGGNQTTNKSAKAGNKLSPEEMKKRMQDSIQPLVADGTITQAQSDKIVEALSTNTRRKDGNASSQNNGQGNSGTDQKSNGQQDKSQDNKQNNNNGQNKPRNNAINKLVSDGVITQAQADAVMKKIGGNFNRKNNGQTPQNNNQTSQQQ